MHSRFIVPALLAAVTLASCGGSSEPAKESTGGYNRPAAPAYTEEQVARTLHIVKDDAGISWQDRADDCNVSVIMTTPQMVQLYADAGDAVATNPSGTVGVKVSGLNASDQVCFDRFQQGLKALK